MSERAKVFTVSEANGLLPRLNVLLEEQMKRLAEIDQTAARMRAAGRDPEQLEPVAGEPDELAQEKAQVRALIEAFRKGWAEVEATGVVVKDMRLGLLDFQGRLHGQLVWLCWKYGEPSVAHWHAVHQGFSSRQPLPRESIPPTLN